MTEKKNAVFGGGAICLALFGSAGFQPALGRRDGGATWMRGGINERHREERRKARRGDLKFVDLWDYEIVSLRSQ